MRIYREEDRLRQVIAGGATVISSFIFYYMSLAPTVTWGDPAKLSIFSYELILNHMPGYHSLHNLIGHFWGLIPFVDYAYGQNVLSAVFSSLTVGIIFIITLKLTQSICSSVVSALVLAVSHSFWMFSVINESYSLMFFLISLTLLQAIIWKKENHLKQIFLVFFFLSLGVSNHYLSVIFIPAFIIYFLVVKPSLIRDWSFIIVVLLGGLLGSSLLLFILFHNNQLPFIQTRFSFFFNELVVGQINSFFIGSKKIGDEIIRYPAYLFYQFPGFGFFVGIFGIKKLLRQDPKLLLLFIMILFSVIIFSLGYQYQRQFNLLTPSYVIFSILIGIGFHQFEDYFFTGKKKIVLLTLALSVLLSTPLTLYYSIPSILRKFNYMPIKIRDIPYRNGIKYFLIPDKSDHYEALYFGNEVFRLVDNESVILGDFTTHEVLRYMQIINGNKPEVILSTDYTLSYIQNVIDSGRSIYIIGNEIHPYYQRKYGITLNNIKSNYNFTQMGPINRLTMKKL